MSSLESFYLWLPASLQNLATSAQGWHIRRTRFGRDFEKCFQEAAVRENWSHDQICDYRDQRLRTFVRHCAESVPYYRRHFLEWGIDPGEICGLDDLSQLPILTKQEVQSNYSELVSNGIPTKQRIMVHTSGTTGGGLRFATTQRAVHEQWAVWWRYRRWHGLSRDIWCGYFGGRSIVALSQEKPPFWRYNIPGKQILFSAYHMRQETLESYIDELRRRRPPWLHGYPSLLSLLSNYLIEADSNLGYEVKWITTGAENLLPQQAELIRKAFGIYPIQHYGMAEGVANICTCEAGSLHVDEDYAAVEFVPNSDGPGYKVVGTNFTNLATPLLRYDVQDIATLPTSDAGCKCGKPGRIVSKIDGRQEDYIVLSNGARLGRMDHIFKDLVSIREAQLYQERPGEIIVRVVKGQHYSNLDEQALLREFRQRVGEYGNPKIVYVDALERSSTGKLRFVISRIPSAQLIRD